MNFIASALLCIFLVHPYRCENVKEVPVRYVSLRTLDSSAQPYLNRGQFLIKRDTQKKPMLIESGNKKLLSVKTASIDELYDTKEFQDLLAEFNLTVAKNKLPSIKDVVSLLGTKSGQETLDAMRDFASTSDGLDLIKNYLEYNVASDKMDDDTEPRASKFYGNSEYDGDESASWWTKLIDWLGLSQSTKIDSKKKDLEILSTVVPLTDSIPNNEKFIGKFFNPVPQTKIPINPPFKVFNSQSINLSNQPYSIDVKALPTIRMTEHQYNEMMKSVNFNPAKLAKYDGKNTLNTEYFGNSDIKRSFSTQSQPIRSSYNLPTGYFYKAHPHDIDKISKILSEKLGR